MSQQPTPPLQSGSMLLFRVAGISVFVHWSWLIVAYFEISYRSEFPRYDSLIWFIVEYLALFGIVILHEFGHALACRQVGGKADYIVLWPLWPSSRRRLVPELCCGASPPGRLSMWRSCP